MMISRKTYDALLECFPSVPPEAGCILGMRDGIISTFAYDAGIPRYDVAMYSPNVSRLNQIIADWSKDGISFCGIAHSHPAGQRTLSKSDLTYIQSIVRRMPSGIDSLYFPLVFPGQEMISFLVEKSENGIMIRPDHIIIHKKE